MKIQLYHHRKKYLHCKYIQKRKHLFYIVIIFHNIIVFIIFFLQISIKDLFIC